MLVVERYAWSRRVRPETPRRTGWCRRSPAQPGAPVRRRPPAAVQGGGADHADGGAVVLQQGDQRGPDRYAAQEVLGAVDGVDQPGAPGGDGAAGLLPGERVVGAGGAQFLADGRLDGGVRVGHGCTVRLLPDPQVEGVEAADGEPVGEVAQTEGQFEVVLRRHGRRHPDHLVRSSSRWYSMTPTSSIRRTLRSMSIRRPASPASTSSRSRSPRWAVPSSSRPPSARYSCAPAR